MPYPGASFVLVWTQHSSMNVPDKGRLHGGYTALCVPADARRCMRPRPELPLHFPLP